MERKKLLLLILFVFISGCATLFSKKTDKITIKTEPSGAEVYYGAELLGRTPFVETFKRDTFNQKKLTIRKEGYQNYELNLKRQLDKIALFNIGFLTTAGASSWATDAFSGAMIEYEPKSYFLELEPDFQQKTSFKAPSKSNLLHFSLLNYDSLLQNIAQGEGPYLRAYYKAFSHTKDYEIFLEEIDQHKLRLFYQADRLEFSRYLKSHIH